MSEVPLYTRSSQTAEAITPGGDEPPVWATAASLDAWVSGLDGHLGRQGYEASKVDSLEPPWTRARSYLDPTYKWCKYSPERCSRDARGLQRSEVMSPDTHSSRSVAPIRGRGLSGRRF